MRSVLYATMTMTIEAGVKNLDFSEEFQQCPTLPFTPSHIRPRLRQMAAPPTLLDVVGLVAANGYAREVSPVLPCYAQAPNDDLLMGAIARCSYRRGRTRLAHASFIGDLDRMRLLIAHGALRRTLEMTRSEAFDYGQCVPLAMALTQGYVDIFRELLPLSDAKSSAIFVLDFPHFIIISLNKLCARPLRNQLVRPSS